MFYVEDFIFTDVVDREDLNFVKKALLEVDDTTNIALLKIRLYQYLRKWEWLVPDYSAWVNSDESWAYRKRLNDGDTEVIREFTAKESLKWKYSYI